jgi:hypothetical protein
MPFDQFTVEQLAGDLLPNATLDQRVATGFHRNTMRNEEGGIDPLEFRYHALVDRVGTTGTTWLGLTAACAQCHTHKFDPITHKEYFGLMAFFNNADEPEQPLPSPDTAAKRRQIEAKIEQLTADLPNRWPTERATFEVAATARTRAKTASAVTLAPSADNVWRADGPPLDRDTYTFEVESDQPLVDRIRVEAVADGGSGPGRTAHGNFVLSEITVTVAPIDAPEKVQTVKLTGAEAAYSQPDYPVANAIDGKRNTGWAISGGGQQTHAATFAFDKPVALPKGGRWTVTLDQQFGQLHTIGHVRLSLGAAKPADDAATSDDRKRLVQARFEAWQAEQAPKAVEWTVLRPAEMKSTTPTLTPLADGSILGSGDIVKSDTYDLTFKPAGLKGVTAVRIEALPHDSLPKHGPGMTYYEGPMGDFCLSEVNLWAGALGAAGAGQPVEGKFAKAVHSYAAGNFEAAKSIDGNPQTGWMINGQQGKPHVAVFALDKPTGPADELKLRMLFERHFAPALGRFRVSVTTDPRVLATPAAMPPEVESALRVPAADRSAAQTAALFRQFLLTAPELAAARQEIDKLFKSLPEPPTTLVMTERPAGFARTQRMYARGEFLQPADPVQPGVPAVLPPLAGPAPGRPPHVRPLARLAGEPADGPRHGQPPLAGVLRPRDRPHARGLRLPGRAADPPRSARLAGRRVRPSVGRRPGVVLKRLHKLIVTSSTYRPGVGRHA